MVRAEPADLFEAEEVNVRGELLGRSSAVCQPGCRCGSLRQSEVILYGNWHLDQAAIRRRGAEPLQALMAGVDGV
jgi:hypothetical protein